MQSNITSAAPLVSCLMVTQQDRLDEVRQSLACFIRQTLQPLELVIVHDGADAYHKKLQEQADEHPEAQIHIHQEATGHSLGWLRNRSVSHATADLVCQWDDDDFNHPARLQIQYEQMTSEQSDFCFMTDQLHLFTEQGFLFWDDWSRRPHPYDLIENTLLGRRDLICHYPDLDKGEDTAIINHIVANQYKVSRLAEKGWLYIYVYNGRNTWDFKHHSEISFLHRRDLDQLLSARERLEEELNQYALPFSQLSMPHEKGKLEFSL